jgi:ferrous iron transport protein B
MNQKTIEVGIIGNPNSGKSSLFNTLTGAFQHVGNWPGKTVEKKEGLRKCQGYKIKFVDLPGTYSIAPYSEEEEIARDYIVSDKPDLVVQTVDVNALERNLYLALEVLSLGKKLILAFNFNKEAERRGFKILSKKIAKRLKAPIAEIEANTGEGKGALLDLIIKTHERKRVHSEYIEDLIRTPEEIDHHKAHCFISKVLENAYIEGDKRDDFTHKLDDILLNKFTALPVFALVVFLMFKATFVLSRPLMELVGNLLGYLGDFVSTIILSLAWPNWIDSFLIDAVLGGVGSVLTYTPLIFILFFFIACLEDTGYLARTVFLVDKLFAALGLTGRAFIPMILGFGCNVPAIMATRTIRNLRERLISILINPFISCSARLPVYVLFTSIFFPHYQALVIMLLYLFGIVTALLGAAILTHILPSHEEATLFLELPPYRLPNLRNLLIHTWHQGKLFVEKAGTIIFAAVVVIWLLASLPLGIEYGSKRSVLGAVGQAISPLFKPLGFGDWTLTVSLIFGLVAKEVIIGTLGTLSGVGEESLTEILPKILSPLGALSLMFFILLYVPCFASIAVIRKETNSWKWAIAQVIGSTTIAWIVAFGVYSLGRILGL